MAVRIRNSESGIGELDGGGGDSNKGRRWPKASQKGVRRHGGELERVPRSVAFQGREVFGKDSHSDAESVGVAAMTTVAGRNSAQKPTDSGLTRVPTVESVTAISKVIPEPAIVAPVSWNWSRKVVAG